MSSGTKKSLESALPKNLASSSAPDRSAARVAGPTPCAPGTVSARPAVRVGETVVAGAGEATPARVKKVGLRTELMEKLLGHVVREEKYQTACLRPIDTSPNREKLLAQCRAQK